MIILNDLHLGCVRRGGVTTSSQEALRTYIFEQFNALLEKANGHDLCLLGDIFDGYEIAPRDWLQAYLMLEAWCRKNKEHKCILVAGNHDVSSKGDRVSSFETLTSVLVLQHSNVCVVGIDDVHLYNGNTWIVAHHRNQDVFELHLNKVLEAVQPGDFVLLHANFSNCFAEASDHSLSISDEQAYAFNKKGVTLVFAHEHQHRVEKFPHEDTGRFGQVVVLGNQYPTSISDCLGNNEKFYWTLGDGHLQKFSTWFHGGEFGYQALDWQHLDEASESAKFIRIVGDATNAEAAQVIDAIHKFRQRSQAFVVTNAVKIDGIAEMGDLPSTFEVAKKFDVMEFVYKQLDPAEAEVIRGIVGEME